MLDWNGLLEMSMQRLNDLASATNGDEGIPSIVRAEKLGEFGSGAATNTV